MTQQRPSAEALEIAGDLPLAEVLRRGLARHIDVLVEQRVSAETERAQTVIDAARKMCEEYNEPEEWQRQRRNTSRRRARLIAASDLQQAVIAYDKSRKAAMTEQPPSAEALELTIRLRKLQFDPEADGDPWFAINLPDAAEAIDALCKRRGKAERDRSAGIADVAHEQPPPAALNAALALQAEFDELDLTAHDLAVAFHRYAERVCEQTGQPGCSNLFVPGEFTAHSGAKLPFKIDCDALTDRDIETLAAEIARRFKFAAVVAIPPGGIRLFRALAPYADHKTSETTLIVDDVLTTGRSMEEARVGRGDVRGVVIFARGPCPDWVTPLFTAVPSDLASAGATSAAPPSPPAVVDYTEQARNVIFDWVSEITAGASPRWPLSEAANEALHKAMTAALSAVASERERTWRDSYGQLGRAHAQLEAEIEALNHDIEQALDGLSKEAAAVDDATDEAKAALLARLREPDVQEAVLREVWRNCRVLPDDEIAQIADAALSVITEKLAGKGE